jgi:hypothetical protein
MDPKGSRHVHMTPPLAPILCQMNSSYTDFIRMHFDMTLSLRLGVRSSDLPSDNLINLTNQNSTYRYSGILQLQINH